MATQEITIPADVVLGSSLIDRLHGLVVTVDHKKLGLMYIGTALGFLVVAGLLAVAIRLQLVIPNNTLLEPMCSNDSSPCTARQWSFWWACQSSRESATISCR